MMNCVKYLFISSWIFLLFACSSTEAECDEGLLQHPNPEQILNGNEYRQSLQDCRLPKVQTFTFLAFQGVEIIGNQGTILHVNPLSFTDQNGNIIDGEITLSLLEMYNPGDMIACQLSTNGINMSDNTEPLISEGVFYIEFSYNNQPVIISNPILLFVPSQNSTLSLLKFNSPSCPDLLCEVLWEQQTGVEVLEEPYITSAGVVIPGYRTLVQLPQGWHSIARYPSTQNKTVVYNKAPNGYNKTNSHVFVVYNSPSLTVGMFPDFSETNKVFYQNNLPVEQDASIVFVSKQENRFVFASQTTTIAPNMVTATLDTQNFNTEEELINAIN